MSAGKSSRLLFAKVPWGVKSRECGGFIFSFLAGLALSVTVAAETPHGHTVNERSEAGQGLGAALPPLAVP